MKQCQRLQAIKAIKPTVAWSLNCLHIIVCVALRCPGELTKDLTLNVIPGLKMPVTPDKDVTNRSIREHLNERLTTTT